MPNAVKEHGVFIASPSDTVAERDAVVKVCETWNRTTGQAVDLRLRPILWEYDSRPETGGPGQNLLDAQIVQNADFLIAIFKYRLGKPTDREVSGTVQEIKNIHSQSKDVTLCVNDRETINLL